MGGKTRDDNSIRTKKINGKKSEFGTRKGNFTKFNLFSLGDTSAS